jgi:hypothetical protein
LYGAEVAKAETHGDLGVALLAAGGLGLYASASLPADHRRTAQLVSGGAIALGAWYSYQAVSQGGGLLEKGRAAVFGSSTELSDDTTAEDLQRAAESSGDVGAAALRVTFVAPPEGGFARRALFSDKYFVTFDVSNTSTRRFVGKLNARVSEDYLTEDIDQVEVRDLDVPALGVQSVRLALALGAAFFLSAPDVTLTLEVDGIELGTLHYSVET